MMKIIVNTISTKKHSGGAFQIAYNFLLKSLEHDDVDWYYITSSDLDEVIGGHFEKIKNVKYFTFPTQPDFKNSYNSVRKSLMNLENKIKADLVYTITAPCYFSFKTLEVMRFTNPLVTHPNRFSESTLTIRQKIRNKFYCLIQKRLMKNAKYFITQTETTKKGILRITGLPNNHVCVVNNVLPSVFQGMETTLVNDSKWINVACVGNPVPHKNFDIIPDVLSELAKSHITNVRFHTTMPFDSPLFKKMEKRLENLGFVHNVVNHGRISQLELAKMYRSCQFCFLPTLLEVFSASTVEAMYFNLPIVATNFEFNKDVLADACLYYYPKDAKDAAAKFVSLIENIDLQNTLKMKLQKQLLLYHDYDSHFLAIKKFLVNVALNKYK